jgi:hypothetical protein
MLRVQSTREVRALPRRAEPEARRAIGREHLRKHYRPDRVRILFVGESPPASGRFFYQADSGLYRAATAAGPLPPPNLGRNQKATTSVSNLALTEGTVPYRLRSCPIQMLECSQFPEILRPINFRNPSTHFAIIEPPSDPFVFIAPTMSASQRNAPA